MLVDREIDGITSVVADTATAFATLAERLIAAGHERLVYVGGPVGSWQDRQRTAALRAVGERHGVRLDVLGPAPATFAAGIAVSASVRTLEPTAVIPYATAIGIGILHRYLADGAEPPIVSSEREIVDALGLDVVPAIDVDGLALGTAAADALLSRIASPSLPAQRVRHPVPVDWDEGAR